MHGISANQEGQIKVLIAKGNKIAAIKLYGEISGVGLKESKDAIETIMRSAPINSPASAQVGEPAAALDDQIKQFLAKRKKIQAVKVYREAYTCGLKEAKDAVDAIGAQMRMDGHSGFSSATAINNDPFAADTQRPRSCLVFALAIFLVALGGPAIFFLMGNGF